MATEYDLVIRGGTIVDGTGAPGYRGDVGIKDGKLVAVGAAPGSATREIDATGKVVCPGFIDVHTHYDAQVLWDRMLTVSPWHGVTTAVMGCCGFGIAPAKKKDRMFMLRTLEGVEGIEAESSAEGLGDWGFETYPEFLELIERRGIAINLGSFVGHTAVRIWVMGEDAASRRDPTPDEMAEMKRIVREAMEAGAVGFSTSNSHAHHDPQGNPVPSRIIRYQELVEFASILADLDVGTFHTTWGPADAEMTPEGITRLMDLTGVPVTDTVVNIKPDGSHIVKLNAIEKAWAKGHIWFPQIPALDNTFEVGLEDPFMFGIDIPGRWRDSAPESHALFGPIAAIKTIDGRLAAYKTAEFREAFRKLGACNDWVKNYWPWLIINYTPQAPELEGRMLLDVAKERNTTPADVLLDLSIESDLHARFGAISGHQDPDKSELLRLIEDDIIRFGSSDAGAHVSQLVDSRYPSYVLGYFVRERGLQMERAIQMMTTMQAEVHGIKDRGQLAEGWHADVVVFDPDTVNAGPIQRVNDQPGNARRLIAKAEGIEYVIVNGTPIREHGKDVVDAESGELPGQLMREYLPISERKKRLQWLVDEVRERVDSGAARYTPKG
ncbi:amidohydrolase family protein [Actinomadura sp. LD22]|uniref:Amidohydrolase family protein n=1 Tax=Actinomadura physcomitrii TaxID=2650748 RepID=A0A6I4MGB4_9ACTN|nr:amidohydrolase family protein [Actinomadura physcomitrii]MWA04822.1 amidohydrolase family protein [Actinomadura physcomitrii]